jgi:hypothetical protein
MKLLKKLKFKHLSAIFWGNTLVILVIVLPWFLKPGYLFMTDTVWGPVVNLDWHSSWFLIELLVKGLAFILPVAFLEKVLITTILALVLLGGRALVRTILQLSGTVDSLGLVFILSLFALFNPFIYDRALYGQIGIIAAYGSLLFVLAYLLKTWLTLNFRNLYYAAIYSALALMFAVHFIFFLAPFYVLFFLGLYLKRQDIEAHQVGRKFWLALLGSGAIILLININWLLALASGSSAVANFVATSISQQDLSAFATAGKTPLETFSNVLLMSGFWGKDQFRYLDLTSAPGWQNSFLLLLPIIIYGIFLSYRGRSRNAKLFSSGLLVIYLLAVVLAVGIKSPLTSGLALFLYNHWPLYKGLREPQKWVAVIIPIYLYYLTLGASRLRSSKFITTYRALSGVILAGVIIMGAPSLLWGFNRQVQPTPYPADWYEADQFLVNQAPQSYGCNDKILFLPWHLYLSFSWSGRVMANPAPSFFSCPVLSGTDMEFGGIYDNSQDPQSRSIETWLAGQGREEAKVKNLAIRYIILAKEVDWAKYSWLNSLSYLQLIKETPTLLVYEVKY